MNRPRSSIVGPLSESNFMSNVEYIRLNRLAKDLCVCERTIRDWISRGLTCYRPSRRLVLIKRTDLDHFLARFKDDKNQIDELVDHITEDLV